MRATISTTATRTFTATQSKVADDYHVDGMSDAHLIRTPVEEQRVPEHVETAVALSSTETQAS